jgi:hypothetical protein
MNRSRTISTATALIASLALPLVGIGSAAAASSHWERYTFEYGPEVTFCDGLVQHGLVEGRTRAIPHGPEGLPYYYDIGRFTETWTNPDTGEFMTVREFFKQSALKVTDNGDGTYTVLFAGPGNSNLYGSDGQLIAHAAGYNRFLLMFDDAGTPGDISDDPVIAFLGSVKHVGKPTADFCETMIQGIG